MYTNSCWAVSCVSSIDALSSIPQLNSLIEIFSQLPVCSVELTCSSSSFGFASLHQVSLLCHLFLLKALFPESLLNFPTHHCYFNSLCFSHLIVFLRPIFALQPCNCFALHCVLTFLFCGFFSIVEITGCGPIFATQVNNFFSIQLSTSFVIFCTVHGHVIQFMDFFILSSAEVGLDCPKGLQMPKIIHFYHLNGVQNDHQITFI